MINNMDIDGALEDFLRYYDIEGFFLCETYYPIELIINTLQPTLLSYDLSGIVNETIDNSTANRLKNLIPGLLGDIASRIPSFLVDVNPIIKQKIIVKKREIDGKWKIARIQIDVSDNKVEVKIFSKTPRRLYEFLEELYSILKRSSSTLKCFRI